MGDARNESLTDGHDDAEDIHFVRVLEILPIALIGLDGAVRE